MSKENQETKLVKSLEVLGALFISIAVLVFLARIILDGVYGGSHLKKTTDIFMLLGVFTACLAFWLQKQVAWAIFFGVLTMSDYYLSCSFFTLNNCKRQTIFWQNDFSILNYFLGGCNAFFRKKL